MSANAQHLPADGGISLADGLSAVKLERPSTPSDVASILRTASDLGHRVVPIGGGLSLLTGNLVPPVDVALDATGLTGIHSYLPDDLTLSVAVGTTFAEISAVLDERGQELPIDVPYPERATIGGLMATGFAGPRRLGSGSLRDLIIGCEYVRGDGLLGHAGGMVVKNVSGFEIPRFLHGSWGSLAVITSVNLKVVPRPRSEATLVVPTESMPSGLERAWGFLAALPTLAACTVTRIAGESSVAIRVMGRDKAVLSSIRALASHEGAPAPHGEVLELSESQAFWQSQGEEWTGTPTEILVSTGTRPRDTDRLVAAIDQRFGRDEHAVDNHVSPGTGAVRFRLDPASVTASEFWERLEMETLPEHTVAYIESAPAAWKGDMHVWGTTFAGEPLMRAIKQQFDPQGVLNTGRLFI